MKLKVALVLLLATTTTFGQTPTISAESARQDLTLLYTSLVNRHPGVYRHTTAAELKARYDEALAAASRNLTFWEFFRIVARLNAAVKCGHTRIDVPEIARNEFKDKGRFFPLTVFFADTTMYVRLPDKSVKRITAINGRKIEVVIQSIFRNISRDGNSVKSKYDIVDDGFYFFYARYVDLFPAVFNIEFISGTTTQTQSIAAVTSYEVENSRLNESEDLKPISFKMLDDVGYLSINSFSSGDYVGTDIEYNDFLKTTFAGLKKNKVRKLIVDIRRNGGGDDQYGANICSYLTTKPFSYFKTVKQKAGNEFTSVNHPCLSVQQPAGDAFTGKICLLIDGQTFSTAADVASITSANKFARVIGRETGGGYDGNTSGRSEKVLLTKSGISLTIPMWYYENAVPPAKELHRGVIPDVLINRTAESIEQKRDLELENAIKYLSQSGL